MERIEELKQELLNQKKEIEAKHGQVNVANLNPSPSEITAGIKTILSAEGELKEITAKNQDVLQGKKFMTSAGKIEEGSLKEVKWQSTTATNADVLQGKQFIDSTGELVKGTLKDVDWESTTATNADVLQGKQFVNAQGDLETGSLKDVDWESTTASASDVLTGKQFVNAQGDLVDGELQPTDFSQTTANAGDVLQGKQFLDSTGALVDGTLKDVDWENTTANAEDVLTGKKFVNAQGELETGSLKDVDWEHTTASAEDVMQGKKFVDATGELISGTKEDVDFGVVTAQEKDVRAGKQFLNSDGVLADGLMPDIDLERITATAGDVLQGKQFVDSAGELKEGLLKDIDLSGITATEQDVRTGKQFVNADGDLVEGSMTGGSADFSGVTATKEDVKEGKKFYDASGELTSGTLKDFTEIFLYNPIIAADGTREADFVFPDDITIVKAGVFGFSPIKMNIWLNPLTTEVREMAFESRGTIAIKNLDECTKLKMVYSKAFKGCIDIDMLNLPESITGIDSYGFHNIFKYGEHKGLKVPPKLNTANDHVFGIDSIEVTLDELIMDINTPLKALSEQMFYGVGFNCDFVVPNAVKTLKRQCCYDSHFNNIILPAGLTSMEDNCLLSKFVIANTITFNSVAPPKIGNLVISINMAKSTTLYVPDSSLDEYKSVFSAYVVKPISEKTN